MPGVVSGDLTPRRRSWRDDLGTVLLASIVFITFGKNGATNVAATHENLKNSAYLRYYGSLFVLLIII